MKKENRLESWHVGTMNDALFIINEPPRPAPVDHHNDSLKTKVIAKPSEPHEEGWTQEQYRAHANLLAAAPDLLKALRPFAEPHNMGDNYVQFHPRLLEDARAAIAKACQP